MYRLIVSVFTIISMFGCISCSKKINPTQAEVKDSIRHYYPIRQGEMLKMVFPVINKGKDPLIINDILTSCGCVVVKKHEKTMIMPGKTQYINITYNSELNTGYVEHQIRIYGNIIPNGMLECRFDVNVVPLSGYGDSRDYEEIYLDQHKNTYKTQNAYYTGEMP